MKSRQRPPLILSDAEPVDAVASEPASPPTAAETPSHAEAAAPAPERPMSERRRRRLAEEHRLAEQRAARAAAATGTPAEATLPAWTPNLPSYPISRCPPARHPQPMIRRRHPSPWRRPSRAALCMGDTPIWLPGWRQLCGSAGSQPGLRSRSAPAQSIWSRSVWPSMR